MWRHHTSITVGFLRGPSPIPFSFVKNGKNWMNYLAKPSRSDFDVVEPFSDTRSDAGWIFLGQLIKELCYRYKLLFLSSKSVSGNSYSTILEAQERSTFWVEIWRWWFAEKDVIPREWKWNGRRRGKRKIISDSEIWLWKRGEREQIMPALIALFIS